MVEEVEAGAGGEVEVFVAEVAQGVAEGVLRGVVSVEVASGVEGGHRPATRNKDNRISAALFLAAFLPSIAVVSWKEQLEPQELS